MRIGTWNLDADWTPDHQELLGQQNCDVWLLTEVSPDARAATAQLTCYHRQLSKGTMARGQHYAAIFSILPLGPALSTHDASVAAFIDGVAFCSSVLPWASCASQPGDLWVGASLETMARPAIDQLMNALPKGNSVWGGDWNQNLTGDRQVGSYSMRALIGNAVSALGQQVATSDLPHRVQSRYTIDHIAVPSRWRVHSADRIAAAGLSDHDAYIIGVDILQRVPAR